MKVANAGIKKPNTAVKENKVVVSKSKEKPPANNYTPIVSSYKTDQQLAKETLEILKTDADNIKKVWLPMKDSQTKLAEISTRLKPDKLPHDLCTRMVEKHSRLLMAVTMIQSEFTDWTTAYTKYLSSCDSFQKFSGSRLDDEKRNSLDIMTKIHEKDRFCLVQINNHNIEQERLKHAKQPNQPQAGNQAVMQVSQPEKKEEHIVNNVLKFFGMKSNAQRRTNGLGGKLFNAQACLFCARCKKPFIPSPLSTKYSPAPPRHCSSAAWKQRSPLQPQAPAPRRKTAHLA